MSRICKCICHSFLVGMLLQSVVSRGEGLGEKERKSCALKIANSVQLGASCHLDKESVRVAVESALADSFSLTETECAKDKNISITCINFDLVNMDAKTDEILLDTNLDDANALQSVSKKIVDLFESYKNAEKK